MDCGAQGVHETVSGDRIRGVRIFDITDMEHPKNVANVQTCRGSHTHTVLVDPKDKLNVYVYVSGSAGVRPETELAGCVAAAPAKDPLRPLMDRGMPSFTELRYRVKVEPSNPQPAPNAPHAGDNPNLNGPLTRYTVRFFLAADGLNLIQGPDGVRRQTIEVALMAYSQEGKPLNWQVRSIWLAIRPDQNALAQSSGIPFHFDFDAPPGDVYLRTGVYDASTSRAGTLEIPLTSITVARK